MQITVAICTWNRAATLGRCLERLAGAAAPTGSDWEVLVVANNCSDTTSDVVAGFRDRLPVRLVHEPRPGLSFARNRAMDSAAGACIAWIDDDVLVENGWCTAYRDALRRWPDAAFFGGPVHPVFLGTPPRWLQRTLNDIGPIFGMRSFGATPLELSLQGDRIPFGCNFAIRLDVQRRYRYDPALGRRPDRPDLGNEETHVMKQMFEDGLTGWWVPGAAVEHEISVERQRLSYVWSQCAGYGEYLVRHSGKSHGPTALAEVRLLARALIAGGRYVARRAMLPPEAWMADFITVAETWGMLRAVRAASRKSGGAAAS